MQPSGAWASPSRALTLLETIEQVGATATGALVLHDGGDPSGVVFVQGGRVCWATSRQMRGRLTDLLIGQTQGELDRKGMESVYEDCRRSGAPLGETLVRIGALSPAGLQRALSVHTAEALLRLVDSYSGSRWQAHRHQTYDARFVFSPVELFMEMCSLWAGQSAVQAREVLRQTVPAGVAAAGFALEDEAIPLAHVGDLPDHVHEVIDVGCWAAVTLDLVGVLDPDQQVLGMSAPSGGGAALWKCDGRAFVAFDLDPSEFAYIVARRRALCGGGS